MKTRVIVILAISAIATLSFTFKSGNNAPKKAVPLAAQQKQLAKQPVGGLMSEDKF